MLKSVEVLPHRIGFSIVLPNNQSFYDSLKTSPISYPAKLPHQRIMNYLALAGICPFTTQKKPKRYRRNDYEEKTDCYCDLTGHGSNDGASYGLCSSFGRRWEQPLR